MEGPLAGVPSPAERGKAPLSRAALGGTAGGIANAEPSLGPAPHALRLHSRRQLLLLSLHSLLPAKERQRGAHSLARRNARADRREPPLPGPGRGIADHRRRRRR